jgi:hypothetical protein
MITTPLPAYLYQQYNNDPDLVAFFTAYNNTSQELLNQTNSLNLPVYTKLSSPLLDWVADSVYGLKRPSLSQVVTGGSSLGVYDTQPYDVMGYSINNSTITSNSYVVNDDYFKRILTWNFYKGDGFQFTNEWLKRRLKRFLYGVNGVDFPIDNTYEISVEYTNGYQIVVTLPNTTISPILKACFTSNVLNIPFQYTFTIDIYSGTKSWENSFATIVGWKNNSSATITWYGAT